MYVVRRCAHAHMYVWTPCMYGRLFLSICSCFVVPFGVRPYLDSREEVHSPSAVPHQHYLAMSVGETAVVVVAAAVAAAIRTPIGSWIATTMVAEMTVEVRDEPVLVAAFLLHAAAVVAAAAVVGHHCRTVATEADSAIPSEMWTTMMMTPVAAAVHGCRHPCYPHSPYSHCHPLE